MEKGRGRESYLTAEIGIDEARESTRETEREIKLSFLGLGLWSFRKRRGETRTALATKQRAYI